MGDRHVQSWQQIGQDVFGNALGNAAIAAIDISRTAKSSIQFDFINGGQGVGAQGDVFASYNASDFPMIASSDEYSTYTGIYGLPGSRGNGASNVTSWGINPWSLADQLDTLNDYADTLAMASGGSPASRYSFSFDIGSVGPGIRPPYLPPTATSLAEMSVTASAVPGYLSMMYADPSVSPGLLTYDFSGVTVDTVTPTSFSAPVPKEVVEAFIKQNSYEIGAFQLKTMLYGATAGVGGLFAAASRALGGGWLANGAVGAGAAAAINSTEQGASILSNIASNGEVGQSHFSSSELGISTVFGFVGGAALPPLLTQAGKAYGALRGWVGGVGAETGGVVANSAQSPLKLGAAFEDAGVLRASSGAFEQGQMTRRLSVRAFDRNKGQSALSSETRVSGNNETRIRVHFLLIWLSCSGVRSLRDRRGV